jgi:DNA-binding transcriptional ArsR family regulator
LVFAALADPTRRAMLSQLRAGPATVAEVGEPFDMTGPAVSKHPRVLERAGPVTRARVAQSGRPPCRPNRSSTSQYEEQFREFWEQRYDRSTTTCTRWPTVRGAHMRI